MAYQLALSSGLGLEVELPERRIDGRVPSELHDVAFLALDARVALQVDRSRRSRGRKRVEVIKKSVGYNVAVAKRPRRRVVALRERPVLESQEFERRRRARRSGLEDARDVRGGPGEVESGESERWQGGGGREGGEKRVRSGQMSWGHARREREGRGRRGGRRGERRRNHRERERERGRERERERERKEGLK